MNKFWLYVIGVLGVLFLSSCSGINKDLGPVHVNDKDGLKQLSPSGAYLYGNDSDSDVVVYYLAAYDAANESPNDQQKVDLFVKTGIHAINLMCQKWFERQEAREIMISSNQDQANSFGDFAMSMLGLGNPSGDLVAALSGSKAVANSMVNNYKESFLMAPSSSIVHRRIRELMAQYETVMLTKLKADKWDFITAYVNLRGYGGICSLKVAKELMNKSLETAIVNPPDTVGDGNAIIFDLKVK